MGHLTVMGVEIGRESLKKWLTRGSGQAGFLIMSLKQWAVGGVLRAPGRAGGW